MSYSIKNLRAVEDVAPKFGLGETQEARFARADLAAESTGISFHVLRSGKRQPFAHVHENAEEVYVVLAGNGRVKLDDDIVDIGPLDAIRVSPKVKRAFEAGDEGLELLAVGPHHAGDSEILQDEGFWDD